MLGSRRTQARRIRDLAEAGVSPEAMAQLHAPVGLDLGASTPEQTAISFAAELVAVRSGRSGRWLSLLDGPIHGRSLAGRRRHRSRHARHSASLSRANGARLRTVTGSRPGRRPRGGGWSPR
ncbi:XdhC family protein [Streptomyces sp. NPDC096132]|uniref:XdhC family protein n=1 Tax=Streptomyces sp. NPDC096132 TaxID=3366075 RepID=UPI0038183438